MRAGPAAPVVALLLVLVIGPAAAAKTGRGVVLPAEAAGSVDSETLFLVETAAREAVRAAGIEVPSRRTVKDALEAAPGGGECATPACLRQLAEALGAASFVRVLLERRGGTFRLRLELLAPDAERPRRQIERRCVLCTPEELERLAQSSAELLMQASEEIEIVIATDPPGAEIEVDGERRGESPVRMSVTPGTHRVEARAGGSVAARREIDAAEDGQQIEIVLPTPASPESAADPRPWGWLSAGAAAGALGAGVFLVSMDGRGTCSPASPGEQCERVYKTGLAGAISLGAGLALAGLSAYFLVRATEDSPRNRAALVPTAGGGVAASASFTW